MSLLALLLAPGLGSLAVLSAALAARAALARAMNRAAGEGGWALLAWLPIRDLLSFAVWATAVFRGGVVWQGRRLSIGADGTIAAAPVTKNEAASR